MKQIVQAMENLCAKGEHFALATVITRNGSAPRSTGAKMLIKQDGGIIGTVGGGMLEAQVQELAEKMIRERRSIIQSFQFNGIDAATMDAICGGQVEVLVEWVNCEDPQTIKIIQGLQTAINQHQKAWLVTNLPAAKTGTMHAFIQQDGNVMGDLPQGLTLEAITETRLPGIVQLGQQLVMIEPIDISGSAFIFGAGHVSRSLAVFVKAVGFWTVVLDDRGEYANRERFPEVDQVIALESFTDSLANLQIDGDSFIVIVTRGHVNDLTVLAQALKTEAGYIGMIGSRRKCSLIFEELRRNGYREEDIQRVHAPIGLPISAETPEEIGISIVAEMIQERSKLQNFTG